MSPGFAIIALVTIAAAVAAMSLRNLVHCALALVVTFAGLAAAYLQPATRSSSGSRKSWFTSARWRFSWCLRSC